MIYKWPRKLPALGMSVQGSGWIFLILRTPQKTGVNLKGRYKSICVLWFEFCWAYGKDYEY